MKQMCLYYALDKWQEEGGYILFRKNTDWCIPHALHLDPKTSKLTHYVPKQGLAYPWYTMFGFDGYVQFGDLEKATPLDTPCIVFGSLWLSFFTCVWFVSRLFTRRNKRRADRVKFWVGKDRRSH